MDRSRFSLRFQECLGKPLTELDTVLRQWCWSDGAQNNLNGGSVGESDAAAELGLDNLLREGPHGRVVVLEEAENEAAKVLLLGVRDGANELAKGPN